ncbi:MAG: hypothetical protein IJ862_04055 [Selenomonadaceae bacterium]|nr:hypothetical protein [Selenomonadaceae bacterium]
MIKSLKEREAKAKQEIEELLNWSVAESKKVSDRLDREGVVRALDTNREAFAYIREIEKKRLKEIAEKYDLPYKINI